MDPPGRRFPHAVKLSDIRYWPGWIPVASFEDRSGWI